MNKGDKRKQWTGRRVLVAGAAASGQAVAAVLRRLGASVLVADSADTPELRRVKKRLEKLGAEVALGAKEAPPGAFDYVVTSPGVPANCGLLERARRDGTPVIGELELGWQLAGKPAVAITGTNGKTTTTELTAQALTAGGVRTVAAGNIGLPVCEVAVKADNLDWLVLEVSSFQLETISEFHPEIAVLMNITPDHFDRYSGMDEYIRAKGRIFLNQSGDDWAVVQLEALAQLRSAGTRINSRLITFSALDAGGDLALEGSRIVCRKDPWKGEWLDMRRCKLAGPHNAENLMAALAASRILNLPQGPVIEALCSYKPAPNRCELVAVIGGVKYINDSKATNVDAVAKAILTLSAAAERKPGIWLIAGGKDKKFDYGEIGQLLARHVRGAFLIGETAQKIYAAWNPFIPCELAGELENAVKMAHQKAKAGEIVLLSPACSSFDQFRNYEHRGDVFRKTVLGLQDTTNCGCNLGGTQHNGGATIKLP